MTGDLLGVLEIQLRRGRHAPGDDLWRAANKIMSQQSSALDAVADEALKGVAMGLHVLAHEQLGSPMCDSSRGWSNTRRVELRHRINEGGDDTVSVTEVATTLMHDSLGRGDQMSVADAYMYAVMFLR
jgi:hypothetical protein